MVEAQIKIGIDGRQAEQDAKRLVRTLESIQAEAAKTRAAMGGIGGAKVDTSPLSTLHSHLGKTVTATDAARAALQAMQREAAGTISGMGGIGTAAGTLTRTMGTLGGGVGMVGLGLGTVGVIAGVAANAIAQAGDAMNKQVGRLHALTGSLDTARESYDDLYKLSLKTGASIADSGSQFARFTIAAKDVGATRSEVMRLVQTVQEFGVVSGASVQEAGAAAQQLGQALASGRLQGDELRSIMENMPLLAKSLADGLGVSVGRLRQMGADGELTSQKVFDTLLRKGADADEMFQKMPLTIDRASSMAATSWERFKSKLDESLKISTALASAIGAVAKAIDNGTAAISTKSTYQRFLDKRKASVADAYGQERSGVADFSFTLSRTGMTAAQEAEQLGELARAEMRLAAQRELAERKTAATAKAEAEVQQTRQTVGDVTKKLFGDQAEVTRQTDELNKVIAAGSDAFGTYKMTASQAASTLQALKEKMDPLAGAIGELNRETALLKIPEGAGRDLEAYIQKIEKARGTGLSTSERLEFLQSFNENRAAKSEDYVRGLQLEADAAKKLAAAQASGNAVAIAHAQAQAEVAKALKTGVIVVADEGAALIAAMAKANADLSGSAGAAVAALNLQTTAAGRLAEAAGLGEAATRAASNDNRQKEAKALKELQRSMPVKEAA